MQTLTEKRVFGNKFGTTQLFVATDAGLVGVTVSADQIGEFGLANRGTVNGVTVDDRGVLIGTNSDVLYSAPPDSESPQRAQSRTFEPVTTDSFGRAVAVGFGPAGPVAADESGVVAGVDEWPGGTDWITVGDTAGVRAVDGELLAAADGVYRLTEAGLTQSGLDDVRDVAAHGTPLASTAEGLFALGNGWLSVREGAFRRVASDGHGHAHAVGPDGLVRCETGHSVIDGDWVDAALPVDSPVVDIAYGGGIVAAITDNGTLCVDAGDGWRHQLLGVRGVNELAVGSGTATE